MNSSYEKLLDKLESIMYKDYMIDTPREQYNFPQDDVCPKCGSDQSIWRAVFLVPDDEFHCFKCGTLINKGEKT